MSWIPLRSFLRGVAAPVLLLLLLAPLARADVAPAAPPASGADAAPAAAAPLLQEGEQPADTTEEEDDEPPLPLEAARTVHINADRGTWISVDVSPDGSTVVFDLLGDLYTVPIEGGDATQLTSGMAFDGQPRYSPDGSEILFISDRSGAENLWTVDVATGDSTQITEGKGANWMSPEWMPDGRYVLASKGETRLGIQKLWMGHVEGGAGAQLIKEPEQLKTVGAEPMPDGRRLWFARRMGSWDYNASLPQYQLAVYDRETGETYQRSSRYGSAFRPTVSPDGRWLVYGTRFEDETGLRIRNLDTGEERWLAYPVQRDDQESIADRDVLPGMSFTPDSEELVASYGGRIWRIPVDGGEPIAVPFRVDTDLGVGPELFFDYEIDDSPAFTVRQLRDATPSPDGGRLAFAALDRLYVVDLPGGEPRRLTDRDVTEAQPAWSPDGRWIAYVSWTPEGGHVWKASADGSGEPVRLSRTLATYQQPAWSPRGDRIVLVRGPARAYQEATGPFAQGAVDDLVWLPSEPQGAQGSDATLIDPADGRTQPHFSEDPDRIYLTDDGTLVSVRWDGTDEKEHVTVVGPQRPGQDEPDEASVIFKAPRGDRALAAVNDHLYTVTVPLVGGETPTISVANPEEAAFPARKLTTVGGQFPAWGADEDHVHWSIGNAHFVYDLARAQAVEDSIKAAEEAEEEAGEQEDEGEGVGADTADAEGADQADEDEDEAGYEPEVHRIEIEAERDIPDGTAVLRGARVITMDGDEVLEDGVIVVEDNRIAAVGPAGEVDVPAAAEEIDVSGRTIVPGFVDTHAHMWPAWGLHKNQIWMYLANLAYGVTTTRDPQTSTTDVITYGDLVEAGRILGPRVYSTGPGVFGDYVEEEIEDLDHARELLRQYSEYYDTKTIKMYMAGNRQQRQWIAIAAREQELMPTTEGGLMMGYNVTMMIDGYAGQEHSFPVYPLYEDVTTLAAETGIYYTPTLLVSYGGPWAENYFYSRENPHDDPKLNRFTPHSVVDQSTRRRGAGWFMEEEHVFQDHARGVAEIVERGGRVGVGSHGQLQGLGYHWELWAMAAGGLSNHDALRAATIFGAEGIGLENDLGSIEAGKLADLVILDGNPLEDLRATNSIDRVMKNGRLYDGDTLDELWPRQRPLERSGWVEEEPATAAGIEDEDAPAGGAGDGSGG